MVHCIQLDQIGPSGGVKVTRDSQLAPSQIKVRVPAALRQLLKASAAQNHRTLNSEVVCRLATSLNGVTHAAPQSQPPARDSSTGRQEDFVGTTSPADKSEAANA